MNQATSSPLRKLAAIMFTDIAGYTQAMSADEETALNTLRKKRSILKPLITDCNGTFVKEIGDGTLSYFPSAIDAATCAVKLQQATYDDVDMNLRIGVHIGDIVFDDDDVFGDGVNVAARLESIAPVGGVCVSKSVFEELLNKKEFDGVPLGLQQLKGVGRLIDVFALKAEKLKQPDPKAYEEHKVEPHSDDEVPSVAVLPLKNKGKQEDAFYAYGITADLISDLSRAGKIRVVSMDDIATADVIALSSKEAAKILHVRYIVNGMLWKHEDMFQLSIEMDDTKTSSVVWSDRWQERWEELSTIKAKLAESLLKALNLDAAVWKNTIQTNTEAYEYYLKGKYKHEMRQNIEDIKIAQGLYGKAIELDDRLIEAKIGLGWSHFKMGDYVKAEGIYQKVLIEANELGDKQGVADSLRSISGIYWKQGEPEKAMDYILRARKIYKVLGDKSGLGATLHNMGNNHSREGELGKALDCYTRSLEIKQELDDKRGVAISLDSIGNIYHQINDLKKAMDYHVRAIQIQKDIGNKAGVGYSLSCIAFIYDEQGKYDTALDYFNRSLEIKEELGDKLWIAHLLIRTGRIYYQKRDYLQAIRDFEKAITIQKELSLKGGEFIVTTVYCYLSNKQLGKEFDRDVIDTLIKDLEETDYELNFRLYELLDEEGYLETAYKQVQEKAHGLEYNEKFLHYPIPKAIVEAWGEIQK